MVNFICKCLQLMGRQSNSMKKSDLKELEARNQCGFIKEMNIKNVEYDGKNLAWCNQDKISTSYTSTILITH